MQAVQNAPYNHSQSKHRSARSLLLVQAGRVQIEPRQPPIALRGGCRYELCYPQLHSRWRAQGSPASELTARDNACVVVWYPGILAPPQPAGRGAKSRSRRFSAGRGYQIRTHAAYTSHTHATQTWPHHLCPANLFPQRLELLMPRIPSPCCLRDPRGAHIEHARTLPIHALSSPLSHAQLSDPMRPARPAAASRGVGAARRRRCP